MIDYPKRFLITDKVAFVIGGLGLLGREIGSSLASAGGRIVILDIDEKRADSLLDGVALAAAVTTAARYADSDTLVAVSPFLAILLHKPIDSLAIVSVMEAGGWSERARNLVGLAYALMVPIGALLFYAGIRNAGGEVLGASLAFSAGLFLCISLADLLPEIQFHRHDRLKLTAALLLGIACAYGVGQLESGSQEPTNPLLRRGMQQRQLN